jgi:farnesyl-diphosphate farnesyltransferase
MASRDELLGDLLRRVSRSFYLSLAILPRPLREPLGLAYLLARAADTVADTRLIARGDRIEYLETLRRAYAGQHADVGVVARAAAPHQAHAAERTLLERVETILARVARLPERDQSGVRGVLGDAHRWHGLRPWAFSGRGRRRPGRPRDPGGARPLHVPGGRLRR